MSHVTETTVEGFPALQIENSEVKAVTIPRLGGKIISLENRKTGFDCMYVNPNHPLIENPYAAPYTFSASGMDELFPNIAAAEYSGYPWEGIQMPDKGEIWTREMRSEIRDGSIHQEIFGVRFPYKMERVLRLEENRLEFSYCVTNLSSFDFTCLWSTQPHSYLDDQTEIKVAGNARFHIDFSMDERLNEIDTIQDWPVGKAADGYSYDFSKIDEIDGGAEKLFLTEMEKNEVSIIYHGKNSRVTFSCNANRVPHVGAWVDRAAWPFDGNPDTLIAVAPSLALSDTYQVSLARGGCLKLPENGRYEWTMEILLSSLSG